MVMTWWRTNPTPNYRRATEPVWCSPGVMCRWRSLLFCISSLLQRDHYWLNYPSSNLAFRRNTSTERNIAIINLTPSIMFTRLSFFLLSALFGVSYGFVARPWVVITPVETRQSVLAMDPSHIFETTSAFLADASDPTFIPGTSGEVSYSKASYYTILGLYLFSFPGLWSTIKRSTAAKVKRKTYVRYDTELGTFFSRTQSTQNICHRIFGKQRRREFWGRKGSTWASWWNYGM